MNMHANADDKNDTGIKHHNLITNGMGEDFQHVLKLILSKELKNMNEWVSRDKAGVKEHPTVENKGKENKGDGQCTHKTAQ